MKKETRFLFIGAVADAKKFVDPEPVVGKQYTDSEIIDLASKNPNVNYPYSFFRSIQVEVPDQIQDVKDVLTPMMRIEVLKIRSELRWELEQIERYIAFGEYPS